MISCGCCNWSLWSQMFLCVGLSKFLSFTLKEDAALWIPCEQWQCCHLHNYPCVLVLVTLIHTKFWPTLYLNLTVDYTPAVICHCLGERLITCQGVSGLFESDQDFCALLMDSRSHNTVHLLGWPSSPALSFSAFDVWRPFVHRFLAQHPGLE